MEKSLADEILRLKRLLAEQESLNRVLHARLEEREREIERLLAQLDKLRRMYFGSQSEKLARRIAQTEAQLQILQQESDAITGRVDDPALPRPLRQTRTRKPFPQALPRVEHRLRPTEAVCPECGGTLSYLGEDTAEQLELIIGAIQCIITSGTTADCTQAAPLIEGLEAAYQGI